MELLVWVVIGIVYALFRVYSAARRRSPRPLARGAGAPGTDSVEPGATLIPAAEGPEPAAAEPELSTAATPDPAVAVSGRRRGLAMSRSELRRAVVLREILGPPRGLG